MHSYLYASHDWLMLVCLQSGRKRWDSYSFTSKQNLMKNGRSWKAFARNPKIFAYDICETGVVFSKKKKKREKNIFAPPFYIVLKKCWTICFLSIAEKMNASFTVFTVKARDICMHWKCKSGRIYRKRHYWKILL